MAVAVATAIDSFNAYNILFGDSANRISAMVVKLDKSTHRHGSRAYYLMLNIIASECRIQKCATSVARLVSHFHN